MSKPDNVNYPNHSIPLYMRERLQSQLARGASVTLMVGRRTVTGYVVLLHQDSVVIGAEPGSYAQPLEVVRLDRVDSILWVPKL